MEYIIDSIGSRSLISVPSRISPAKADAMFSRSFTGSARRVLITCGVNTMFWFMAVRSFIELLLNISGLSSTVDYNTKVVPLSGMKAVLSC